MTRRRFLCFSSLFRMTTLALASVALCSAQQDMRSTSGVSDGRTQNSPSCDNFLGSCGNDLDEPEQLGSSSPELGASSPGSRLTNRNSDPESLYNFGNGEPVNLSPQGNGPASRDQAKTPQIKLPPEPPTEFQRFVADDIGTMLPIYGNQLFSEVPSTFAPLDRVPVTPNYAIGPGDELLLRASGSITFYLREIVDRSGNIYIPHVGLIQVAGTRFTEIRDYLTQQISREFKRFDLSVEMGHLRSIQVFVVGRTRRPGSYTVSSLSTLVNSLFAAGGPSRAGSMRHIELRRGTSSVSEFDLYALLLNGDKSKDVPLLPGDVIYIAPAGPRVALAGSVSEPAIFEIRKGETVGDLLKMAGGLTSLATLQSGEIERIDNRGERQVLEIRFDEAGLATPLKDGDILRVLSIVPRFDNEVTLRGNVANPGRYPWHSGMRVRDLIPDKESLLTRDYWKRKNRLVSFQAKQPTEASDGSPNRPAIDQSDADPTSGFLRSPGTTEADDETSSPGKFGRTESSSATPVDRGNQPPRSGQSSPQGESIASQSGSPSSRFPVTNQVELRVPEIDWDYAVIERKSSKDLTTSLKSFNLGQAVLHDDETQNMELQPGDVVTIFSQADIHVPQTRRTKFVRLEGEFKSAGVYSVEPGETLRELVERSGGLTPQAYLFGSSFTRVSTRDQQQARLDQYSSDLEQDIDRAAVNRSTSAVTVEEAAAVSSSLESQRALVQKLKLVRATGRIVLDIAPTSHSVSDIPDIPLEDGDSFVVPSRPSSVSVIGSVYDQNAFVFEGERKADDYLQLAGGITKDGDSRHAFVIRADGSVVSRKSRTARTSGGFDSLHMNPGDAVVIPELVNKTTVLRGLTDWSSIFSQFGLGAAAINVLR
jgi:polysaccharide export outer membrane protein